MRGQYFFRRRAIQAGEEWQENYHIQGNTTTISPESIQPQPALEKKKAPNLEAQVLPEKKRAAIITGTRYL